MTTVIRVKRKKTDRPAETLLVVSRAAKKIDRNHGTRRVIEPLPDTQKKIFRFATTVKSNTPMNDEVKEKVRKVILLQEKCHVIKERSKNYLNDDISLGCLKKKLKSMAVNHSPAPEKQHLLHPSMKSSPYRRPSSSARAAIYSSATAPFKREIPNQQYHHSQKQAFETRFQSRAECQVSDRFTKVVPCHSERYLGQVGQRNAAQTRLNEGEYVYDLYYCPKTKEWNVKDVLYVKPCKCENPVSVKPSMSRNDMQKPKKVCKSKIPSRKSTRIPDKDDDSIDEDERRFIFDEEEDFNDSDDYDVCGRDEDVGSFFGGGYSDYDGDATFDDYEDNVATEFAAFEQDYDYGNDNYDDYGGNDPND